MGRENGMSLEDNLSGCLPPLVVGTIHKLKQAVAIYLTQEMIDGMMPEVGFDVLMESYVIKITRDQFGELLGKTVIAYPANWKEAIKDRWFPDWLKKRFPVQYQSFDIAAFYPEFSKKFTFPNDKYVMRFIKQGDIFPSGGDA